jgi:hypothetical protein
VGWSEDQFVVRPGVGLGALRFGASEEEVRAYLGPPDRPPDSGHGSVKWFYSAADLYVSFLPDDAGSLRLRWFSTMSPKFQIEGRPVVHLPIAQALENLRAAGIELVREHDPGHEHWWSCTCGVELVGSICSGNIDELMWVDESSESSA